MSRVPTSYPSTTARSSAVPLARLRSAIASAAGTALAPGWVIEARWESSVSSACANTPFASAALSAVVTIFVPATEASLVPPSVFTCVIAHLPGRRREPDTIAASVSSR